MAVNGSASPDQQTVANDFLRFMAMDPEVWLAQTTQLTPVVALQNSQSARQIIPFLDVALHDQSIAHPSTRTDFGSQLNTALTAATERVLFENQHPRASLAQASAVGRRRSSRSAGGVGVAAAPATGRGGVPTARGFASA